MRQKIVAASKEGESIHYDDVFIQALLLRAFETGIKDENIINYVRPYIKEATIDDDQTLNLSI